MKRITVNVNYIVEDDITDKERIVNDNVILMANNIESYYIVEGVVIVEMCSGKVWATSHNLQRFEHMLNESLTVSQN